MNEKKENDRLTVTKNPWKIATVVLVMLSGVLFVLALQTTACVTSSSLTPQQAADKAIEYINTNLLRGQSTATLINVEEAENGLYKMKINIGGQVFDSYMTKDAKILFPSGINMEEKQETTTTTRASFDAPDTEKPNVKFFVMSFCPFGNQAEKGLDPVAELLGSKVDFEPHYVIYSNYASGYPDYCLDEENKYCSMHGIQELNQDVRELCVWKYYPSSTWWDFVMKVNDQCDSRNADTCWEAIATEVGIDVDKIKTCQEDEALALLEAELSLNAQYNVRGSPTVFINDQEYRGARDPESYKQAVCSGFVDVPEACSQSLGSSQVAPASGSC
jgi:glutaredoxin